MAVQAPLARCTSLHPELHTGPALPVERSRTLGPDEERRRYPARQRGCASMMRSNKSKARPVRHMYRLGDSRTYADGRDSPPRLVGSRWNASSEAGNPPISQPCPMWFAQHLVPQKIFDCVDPLESGSFDCARTSWRPHIVYDTKGSCCGQGPPIPPYMLDLTEPTGVGLVTWSSPTEMMTAWLDTSIAGLRQSSQKAQNAPDSRLEGKGARDRRGSANSLWGLTLIGSYR